jgi:hypothetical protein
MMMNKLILGLAESRNTFVNLLKDIELFMPKSTFVVLSVEKQLLYVLLFLQEQHMYIANYYDTYTITFAGKPTFELAAINSLNINDAYNMYHGISFDGKDTLITAIIAAFKQLENPF